VDTIDTVEAVESGGDIVLSDGVLSDEVDLMVARLWALEEELRDVKTRNSDLEGTVTTLTASLAESTLQNNLLYTEVETLTGELDLSQVALTKRRGDLRIKNAELVVFKEKLKESEQSKETEVKELTKLYKESSTDLHILTTRCRRLNSAKDRLVALPTPVRSNNYVTVTRATFEECAKQLANAQIVAGNSALTVLSSLYQRRGRISSGIASNWKKKDVFTSNVRKICMEATESLLVDFWCEFNSLIEDNLKYIVNDVKILLI
jgi:hypothetical protein